jgi:hypothetical protein
MKRSDYLSQVRVGQNIFRTVQQAADYYHRATGHKQGKEAVRASIPLSKPQKRESQQHALTGSQKSYDSE